MTHCTQIVYLIGLGFLNDPDQVGGIGQITVMKDKSFVLFMRILIQMINPVGVEERTSRF